MRRVADQDEALTSQLNIAVSKRLLRELEAAVRELGTTQSGFARSTIERRIRELGLEVDKANG